MRLSVLRALLLALTVFAVAGEANALDRPGDPGTEVWLVTYGPGEVYWQRFGHNAIWVRDPARGLDHTFNYGFFDFAQENFFLRFLMGRMRYFSAAQPSDAEFAQYVSENRSIRAQRLALSKQQSAALVRSLLHDIRPENREYLYDYYADNCSTRVRDALDRALGGAIREAAVARPANADLRDHTRRLTQGDFWLYLGLEAFLGRYTDRPIDRWQELFIPGELEDEVTSHEGLVIEDAVLFESTLPPPPAQPDGVWWSYLLGAVLLLAVTTVFRKRLPVAGFARAWFALSGIFGLAILFLWFGTDHVAAGQNLNLLVFNPLWLVPAFAPGTRRYALALVAPFSLFSIAIAVTGYQYSADVVAAFVPLNLASAWLLQGNE
jgi:hypothetical protein